MRFVIKFSILLVFVFVSACGSKKKTIHHPKTDKVEVVEKKEKDSTSKTEESNSKNIEKNNDIIVRPNQTTKDYVIAYADIAMQKMREHNIPASITLAQGILESGSGNSVLTKKSNNHFGIKCHKEWTGEKVYHDDDAKGECFRVYEKAEGSFEDHSQFLLTRGRYASLFKLEPGDYVGWAYGLKAAGYATDPKYPQKLIAYIEKYELDKYDEQVLGQPAKLTIIEKKKEEELPAGDFYVVKKGDGLYAIGKKFNLTVDELKSLNGLTSNDLSVGQKLKVKKSENPIVTQPIQIEVKETTNTEKNISIPEFHLVEKGEGLYGISKKYGISIDEIKSLNQLESEELSIGQKLFLQKPVTKVDNSIPVISKDTIDKTQIIYHTVTKGEGLYSISKKYDLTVDDLMVMNELTSDVLIEGQILKVGMSNENNSDNKNQTFQITPQIKQDDSNLEVPLKHIVQKNETLNQIAYKYELEVPFLRKLNKLTSDTLNEGQVLWLKSESVSSNEKNISDQKIHVVQKGDTLYSISKLYGIPIDKLTELNQLSDAGISIGQVLKLE
jgi:LysM repeat protein/flagellum-specific peptidoglycan hydrolase FlgJ